eukprot:scaffold3.g6298.t1
MNAGAEKAKGDVLVFLHADSQLPDGYADLINAALQQHERWRRPAEWGAFESITIGEPPLAAWVLRHAVALRTRLLGVPYGDQAIFVRSGVFRELGGYQNWPLLEDLDLVRRLRAQSGAPALVPRPLATSGRRWQQLGLLRTTLTNQTILLGHALGVDVHTLAAWYRRGKG